MLSREMFGRELRQKVKAGDGAKIIAGWCFELYKAHGLDVDVGFRHLLQRLAQMQARPELECSAGQLLSISEKLLGTTCLQAPAQKIKIVLRVGPFRSPGDESNFLLWVSKIPGAREGELEPEYCLYFDAEKSVSKSTMLELFALFERYRIDKSQLILLKSKQNSELFRTARWKNPAWQLQSGRELFELQRRKRLSRTKSFAARSEKSQPWQDFGV